MITIGTEQIISIKSLLPVLFSFFVSVINLLVVVYTAIKPKENLWDEVLRQNKLYQKCFLDYENLQQQIDISRCISILILLTLVVFIFNFNITRILTIYLHTYANFNFLVDLNQTGFYVFMVLVILEYSIILLMTKELSSIFVDGSFIPKKDVSFQFFDIGHENAIFENYINCQRRYIISSFMIFNLILLVLYACSLFLMNLSIYFIISEILLAGVFILLSAISIKILQKIKKENDLFIRSYICSTNFSTLPVIKVTTTNNQEIKGKIENIFDYSTFSFNLDGIRKYVRRDRIVTLEEISEEITD